ncbi:MAG: NAD-dependent epimerase/dehydratase family protein [Chloroflexota bacterium]|nr:NAD-dependent epimerase/dehydratase family protein [Chloroflexota bacterium]
MILVTGGTGFIGNVLIRHLSNLGYSIKLLIRPSKDTPNLPRGIPLEIAVASLSDERGLRAAMKDVDVVFHLATAESFGRQAQLEKVDIRGTEAVVQAATRANVSRFVYLSHLGSDRISAYPLLKAKGIAEHYVRESGLSYTVFRSALVYGERDHFTNGLAFLLKASPGLVLLPDNGSAVLQPIWVEDLVTTLTWALDMPDTINQTIEIGGPEYLTFREICKLIARKLSINRAYVNTSPVFLNILTEVIEIFMPAFPTSVFWLDYLATNRTASLDVLPSQFNLLPAKMSQRLGYLEGKRFRRNWWRIIKKRKREPIRWE